MTSQPSVHLDAVEKLLDHWFAAGYTRSDFLPFDSTFHSHPVALCAARIFKRGANGIRNLQTGEETQLHHTPPSGGRQVHSIEPSFFALLDRLAAAPEKCLVICDENVSQLHPTLELTCKQKTIRLLKLNCCEEEKSFATFKRLIEQCQATPEALVVVGGGIACDVGGFVGGFLGARIHLVPTTLLAAVDAGLGGKTGVNHHTAGKNQIGLFVELAGIHIIPEFFKTLSASLIRQGTAEILKHSFLSGTFEHWQPLVEQLVDQPSPALFQHTDFAQLIEENLKFKAAVVEHDPREKNIRALLNFGHTLGHMLETLSQSGLFLPAQAALPHGTAVALGLLYFYRMGFAKKSPNGFVQTLERLLAREGVIAPLAALNDIAAGARLALLQDKKNITPSGSLIRCITPEYGCLQHLPDAQSVEHFLARNTTELNHDALLNQLQMWGLFS